MSNTYQIYLVSDSTGETLDRVFLAIKAQFKNIEYDVKSYFFTRTENQVEKIIEKIKKKKNSIILYTHPCFAFGTNRRFREGTVSP